MLLGINSASRMAPNQSKVADHFPLFTKLPPEIRTLIWEAALPRRSLPIGFSKGAGYEILGPPTIAQVCGESRAVALRHGSPQPVKLCPMNAYPHLFTWLDPSRDAILHPDWYTPHPFPETASVTLGDLDWDYTILSNEKSYVRGLKRLLRTVKALKKEAKNTRIINLTFYSFEDGFGMHPAILKPGVGDAILGIDWFRTVDLRDENEVEFISHILYGNRQISHYGQDLVKSHAAVRGLSKVTEQQKRHYSVFPPTSRNWDVFMQTFKYHWLNYCYKCDQNHTPLAVRVNLGQEIDEGNAWIKTSLEQLPEIRPVYLITRYPTEATLSHEGKWKEKPKVLWNGWKWERRSKEASKDDDDASECFCRWTDTRCKHRQGH